MVLKWIMIGHWKLSHYTYVRIQNTKILKHNHNLYLNIVNCNAHVFIVYCFERVGKYIMFKSPK